MTSTVIHCLRYRDAPAMIDWLERVLGFQRGLVVEDGDGGVAHAQLTHCDGPHRGMVMLGSARDDAFGRLQRPPQPAGPVDASVYLIAQDVDAIWARALAEGAEITAAPHDADHGGRSFSCRDPEGALWSVGSYDPWSG